MGNLSATDQNEEQQHKIMEDVSDKCWYCKAILPHHQRFGPLLRTTMSYEAIKRVFVSGIARRIRGEGFSSKSNTSLLCILSR